MLKRYDGYKDEMVELTQEYFDSIQSQFAQMMFHYSKNAPEKYKEFCKEYHNKVNQNV